MLIAKVAVYFLCRQFEKYFTSNKAEGQADNAELVALLKQALIKVRDDESEVSQLELLAQIPIKVSVESVGNFEDLTLSPTLA